MKKFLLTLIIVLVLMPAAAVSAGPKVSVGERMTWHVPEYTFPANTPFHQEHGWIELPLGEYSMGGFSFVMELDGVMIKPSYKLFGRDRASGLFDKTYVYNFPAGMTGEHVFTGYYYVPCQYALDFTTDTCTGAGTSVLFSTLEMTVTFE